MKLYVLLILFHPSDRDVNPDSPFDALISSRLMPAPGSFLTLPHLTIITHTLRYNGTLILSPQSAIKRDPNAEDVKVDIRTHKHTHTHTREAISEVLTEIMGQQYTGLNVT